MREDFLPSNPGPIPAIREVRRAMDAPMVSHPSAEFGASSERARDEPDQDFERSVPSRGGDRLSPIHALNGYGR